MPHGRGYGCIPDDPRDKAPSGRDHKFTAAAWPTDFVVPDAHDLTGMFPPVMDQGPYGTCTVHAATAAFRYNLINTDRPDVELSRSQLYWDAGVIEGDTSDIGRQVRDVVKAAANTGIAGEDLWPYERLGQQPPEDVYVDAQQHMALEYQRVDIDRAAINAAIYIGHPVIIGIEIYPAFETDEVAATGLVPMPKFGQTPVSAHCMLLGAYDLQWDLVLNSWSTWFGLPEKKGYCKLPRGYLEKYGSDLWTLFINK